MFPFSYRLTRLHSRLDTAIRREQESWRPLNPWRLLRLKKLKLLVKDRLRRVHEHHLHGIA
ncbi:MAG: DUF465 domain-containing protein [Alphaproteobacteria bacterium]|nr:DUF465 domain-containing protein [Alphaproteobacteria bacterium]